jgi:hypothetical protein
VRFRAALLCASLLAVLASCSFDNSMGYVEIRSALSGAFPLYLDSVRLAPLRNGNALLRQKVGISKLQMEGEGGSLAVLCTIDVRKNRITSITLSSVSRHARCQCGRNGGTDTAGNRTCIG